MAAPDTVFRWTIIPTTVGNALIVAGPNGVRAIVLRFRDAVAVSEAFIERVEWHDAFSVTRIEGGTNLFELRVDTPDPAAFRRRVGGREVDLGAPRSGGRFLLGVNETWNRVTADDLSARFVAAL